MPPLRNLLWMIVAIAAVVLLAPATASAHESHRAPLHTVALPAALSATLSAAHQHHDATTNDVRGERRLAMPQASGLDVQEHDGVCTAGCCFGMGCCAGTILSDGPALDPPAGQQALIAHAPQPLASARPTSLIEPPNTLA